jgi:hypothetical protein
MTASTGPHARHASLPAGVRLLLAILIPAILAFAGWSLGQYDARKLDVSRFVADSVRRDVEAATDHGLLLRIDRRLTALYCGRLPLVERPGCQ